MKYNTNHPVALEISQALDIDLGIVEAMTKGDDFYVRCVSNNTSQTIKNRVHKYCDDYGYRYSDRRAVQKHGDANRKTTTVLLRLSDDRLAKLESLSGDSWQDKIYQLIDSITAPHKAAKN